MFAIVYLNGTLYIHFILGVSEGKTNLKANKREAVGKITILLVSVIVVLLLVVSTFDLIPHLTQNNSLTQNSQNPTDLSSSGSNLTSFILLNNLAASQNSYKIYNTLRIESLANTSLAEIIVWAVNHTSSITINSTTALIQTHYNSCAMQTYRNLIQWPVSLNYSYPVIVYAGYVAGTPDTPSQNYFVVGYVSNEIPYIIYRLCCQCN